MRLRIPGRCCHIIYKVSWYAFVAGWLNRKQLEDICRFLDRHVKRTKVW